MHAACFVFPHVCVHVIKVCVCVVAQLQARQRNRQWTHLWSTKHCMILFIVCCVTCTWGLRPWQCCVTLGTQQGCQTQMGGGACKAGCAGGLESVLTRDEIDVPHLTLVAIALIKLHYCELLGNACAFLTHITQSVTQSIPCDDG
jgi:hypothetical protein